MSNTQAQLHAIRDRDRLKWGQANSHLIFKHLRNGVLNLSPSASDVADLLDDSKPQPWRTRPAKGALPRVVPGTGLAGASRIYLDAAAVANPRLRPPFSYLTGQVALNEEQRALATTWVNTTARQLSRIVCRTVEHSISKEQKEYSFSTFRAHI